MAEIPFTKSPFFIENFPFSALSLFALSACFVASSIIFFACSKLLTPVQYPNVLTILSRKGIWIFSLLFNKIFNSVKSCSKFPEFTLASASLFPLLVWLYKVFNILLYFFRIILSSSDNVSSSCNFPSLNISNSLSPFSIVFKYFSKSLLLDSTEILAKSENIMLLLCFGDALFNDGIFPNSLYELSARFSSPIKFECNCLKTKKFCANKGISVVS